MPDGNDSGTNGDGARLCCLFIGTLLREDMKKHRAFGVFSLVPSWGIAPRELCRSHEQLGDDIFRVRHYAALAITPAAKNSQSVGCFLNAAFDSPFRTKKQMRLIIINRIYFGTPVGGKHEKTPNSRCFFIGTLMGNRTPDSAVHGESNPRFRRERATS